MRILITLACLATSYAQTAANPGTAPAAQTGRAAQVPVRSLGDLADLARYAAENARIQPPRPGEERVVFLGSSVTDSWGRRYGKFFPVKPYINRGISGQLTTQMLLRFRADVIALKPRVVVILGGGNDIGGSLGPVAPAATRDNIMSMVELARANGIRVVLCSLTPVCDSIQPQTDKRPIAKLAELNAWMKDYAARENIVYLDYWSAMLDGNGLLRPELTYDCLHPNDAGYALMEPLAAKAIAAALHPR